MEASKGQESKTFVRKVFILLFALGVFFLIVIAILPEGMFFQRLGVVLGIIALGFAHIIAMRYTLGLIKSRVAKTERILEENYSKELQEYTEKLEQETEKLQETTDFLNSILDSSTEYSIITTGKDGKITLFNKGAERMIGYSAEELVGKEQPFLFLRSSSTKSFAQIGLQIMKYGVDEGEWEVIRKDGQLLTVIFTVTPMKNREGKMLGFLGIAKDVTEQKKLERQYRITRKTSKKLWNIVPKNWRR